jgi:hypothetical protein
MIPEPYRSMILAMSLDFEGTIRIGVVTSKKGVRSYNFAVRVNGTHKGLLDSLKERVGCGFVNPNPSVAEGKAPIYFWSLSTEEIRVQIPQIIPHLIAKKQQATLLHEALQIAKPKSYVSRLSHEARQTVYTKEQTIRMWEIFCECQALNAKPAHRAEALTDAQKLLIQLRKR